MKTIQNIFKTFNVFNFPFYIICTEVILHLSYMTRLRANCDEKTFPQV